MSKKNLHLMILILKNVNFTKYLIDANNVNIGKMMISNKVLNTSLVTNMMIKLSYFA